MMNKQLKNIAFLLGTYIITISCSEHNIRGTPTSSNAVKAYDAIGDSLHVKAFYDEYKLNGAFVIYNLNKKSYKFYNKALLDQPESPASTFNITTALIALEEGICKSENTLAYAFQHNIDRFFWELRNKIGAEKMKAWLKNLNYGTGTLPEQVDSMRVTPQGKDMFWVVSGQLRITPLQQLGYIEKLYADELPFSKHNMTAIRKLMYEKDINGYQVFGKRGSYLIHGESKYIGWFVGWAKKGNDAYIFVNYVETPDLTNTAIIQGQKEIALKILESEAVLD
jgi:beta-lactamase class D